MEFIGEENPAPQLKDGPPKNPKSFLNKIIKNIRLLEKAEMVHGDLSEYNILNNKEEPIFIDFSQTTEKKNILYKKLLDRDINNIQGFLKSLELTLVQKS